MTTINDCALPWVVMGSDVLQSRMVCWGKSVFNRSSYEVGVHWSACWGGLRWVCDTFPLTLKHHFPPAGPQLCLHLQPFQFSHSHICRNWSPCANNSKESMPSLTWLIKSCINLSCLLS